MKYFDRHNQPDILSRHSARWNQQWVELKTRNSGASFQWYRHLGVPVNQYLSPLLANQTQDHCSYCDAFPPKGNDKTIDHFQPKSLPVFYALAYSWANLYFACGHCQAAKMEDYSDLLLRPDAPDYSFDRYFVYNYTTHGLEPNPGSLADEQARANATIQIFQFNHPGQVISRRHAWERWCAKPINDRFLEDFPFRFMLF